MSYVHIERFLKNVKIRISKLSTFSSEWLSCSGVKQTHIKLVSRVNGWTTELTIQYIATGTSTVPLSAVQQSCGPFPLGHCEVPAPSVPLLAALRNTAPLTHSPI